MCVCLYTERKSRDDQRLFSFPQKYEEEIQNMEKLISNLNKEIENKEIHITNFQRLINSKNDENEVLKEKFLNNEDGLKFENAELYNQNSLMKKEIQNLKEILIDLDRKLKKKSSPIKEEEEKINSKSERGEKKNEVLKY